MGNIQISTTQNVNIQMESASALHRAGAILLDLLLLGLLTVGLVLLYSWIKDLVDIPETIVESMFIGVGILCLLYPMIAEMLLEGQTLGKKIVHLRVVCLDGSRPTIGAYAIRWVLGLFELVVSYGSIAFVTVLLSRNSQRIGDMVAGTTVVKVKRVVTLDELILTTSDGTVEYPQARNLSDDDVQVLRDLLSASRTGMDTSVVHRLTSETALGLEQRLLITRNKEHIGQDAAFIQEIISSYSRIHGD